MEASGRGAHAGIAAALLVFISSMFLILWQHPAMTQPQGLVIPWAAPAWSARDIDGGEISSAELQDRITVLFFNSVRCSIANKHALAVRQLADRYRRDSRVQFVAVYSDVTCPNELREIRVQNRVLEQPFRCLIDDSGRIAADFGRPPVLTYFVIDGDGMIRETGSFRDNGGESAARRTACERAIDQLLHAPAQLAGQNLEGLAF
jgi:hypothetical protein